MRPSFIVIVSVVAALAVAHPVRAQQSASTAVLATLPNGGGSCRTDAGLRTVVLQFDGQPSRSLSAVTNTRGAVVAFSAVAVAQTGDARRETENVSISFTDDERFLDGERRSTANAAAQLVDDRRAPVSGGEAVTALYLAKQVLARCAPGAR